MKLAKMNVENLRNCHSSRGGDMSDVIFFLMNIEKLFRKSQKFIKRRKKMCPFLDVYIKNLSKFIISLM